LPPPSADGPSPGRDPEDHWEERLALPVIIAALASVPAVFLTLLDSPYETVGSREDVAKIGELAYLVAQLEWLII